MSLELASQALLKFFVGGELVVRGFAIAVNELHWIVFFGIVPGRRRRGLRLSLGRVG
jgi:hypothetical protein